MPPVGDGDGVASKPSSTSSQSTSDKNKKYDVSNHNHSDSEEEDAEKALREAAMRDCCFNNAYWDGFSSEPLPPRVIKNKCDALFFHWFGKLVDLGVKRPIQLQDLWHVPEFNKAKVVTPNLEAEFAKQRRLHPDSKRVFFRALVFTRFCDTLVCGFYKMFGEGILYALPMLTQLLIQFVEEPTEYEWWFPYVIVLVMCVVNVTHTFVYQGYIDLTQRVGMHRRVAAQGMIYRKSLRVDQSKTSAGQISNLMSNDATKLQMGSLYVHNFYWQPLSALVCLILLYNVLGVASIAGLAVMLILVPFQAFFGKKTTQIRRKTLEATDRRVSAVRETLLGIKILKILTGERNASERGVEFRKKELHQVVRSYVIEAINFLMLDITPVVVTITTFSVYVALGGIMTPSIVFTAVALLAMLRKPLQMFPKVMTSTLDGWVAAVRLGKFLELPEIQRRKFVHEPDPDDVAVIISQAHARWRVTIANKAATLKANEQQSKQQKQDSKVNETDDNDKDSTVTEHQPNQETKRGPAHNKTQREETVKSSQETFGSAKLSGISLALGPGASAPAPAPAPAGEKRNNNNFGIVIGAVGTGKSSLMHLLLGEMQELSNEDNTPVEDNSNSAVSVRGSVAYVPQVPFVMNETIRQNILFGRSFNPDWYDRVVEACCLKQDLEDLPSGDLTLIGERGVTLSGGQKMRVALARAVYADAQVGALTVTFWFLFVSLCCYAESQHVTCYVGECDDRSTLLTMPWPQWTLASPIISSTTSMLAF